MTFNRIISFATETVTPDKGEVISKALLNTAMGLAIVFTVLVLISFIISLFKFIYKAQNRSSNKAEVKAVETVKAEEISTASQVDLTDDSELVAVITAAIYAYEAENQIAGGQDFYAPDGLFIRSIRKVNKRKALY